MRQLHTTYSKLEISEKEPTNTTSKEQEYNPKMNMRMQRIELLNNQATCMLAAEEYDCAIMTLTSALEELLSHSRFALLDANRFDGFKEQASFRALLQDLVSSASQYFPLPTCITEPPGDESNTFDIFRECFTIHRKWPVALNDDETQATKSTNQADSLLLTLVLYFNLGLCHHRRGLAAMAISTAVTVQPHDLVRAENLYRRALQLVDSRQPTVTFSNRIHGQKVKHSHSTYWLLILAVINNLGCLAKNAADAETVQDCLALGLLAMQSINLPLDWTNRAVWCNPASAA